MSTTLNSHARELSILAYHSFSNRPGPASISPAAFTEHLNNLAALNYRTIPLAALTAWLRDGVELPERAILLTFDDGYADFASAAFPELQRRGLGSTVFIPAGKIGGFNDWDARAPGGDKLLSADAISRLARAGVEFGAHGMSHTDLTRLPVEVARDEVVTSKRILEEISGRDVEAFAPPYGRSDPRLRATIERCYTVSAGTVLDRVRSGADVFDLPRIDMWYLRNPRLFREYLEHGFGFYLGVRRALRQLRRVAAGALAARPGP